MAQFSNDKIISLVDLTSLNETDTEFNIEELCQKAHTPLGDVAAVCVYPRLVHTAHTALHSNGYDDIAVATVVNFPHGNEHIKHVIEQTTQAIKDGANEIDVVIPYKALMKGDEETTSSLLKAVCDTSHEHHALVKVILETGALQTQEWIVRASEIAIAAGADFLKTSTGKIETGATLQAVDQMLMAINAEHVSRKVGIKISGGVRTREDAQQYLDLIADRMTADWITPANVRIGASSLLGDLLK